MEKKNFSDGIAKPWIELHNSCWNFVYKNTFHALTQTPFLGPVRGMSHQLMQALDAWAQLYPSSVNYQIVLVEIQIQALETLLRELISLADEGETVTDWSQLQQLWSSTLDKAFEQAFCVEDNLKVRGNLLNAVHSYQLHQQALMEMWMKMMNLPLRSEVDEIHKNIYELRKEVKSLKKTLAHCEAQTQINFTNVRR